MKLLGVDTTNKCAKIVLIDKEIKMDELSSDEKQSENLMHHIDDFLAKNNLNVNDIDVFGAVVGPGSFTGIRVGVATIKAFAYACEKPLISTNVFDVVAKQISDGVCVLNCTSSSVYYGVIKNGKTTEMGVCSVAELSNFKSQVLFSLEEEHLDNSIAYKFNVITNYNMLLQQKFAELAKDKVFVKNLEPLYLQLSQAERNLESKHD